MGLDQARIHDHFGHIDISDDSSCHLCPLQRTGVDSIKADFTNHFAGFLCLPDSSFIERAVGSPLHTFDKIQVGLPVAGHPDFHNSGQILLFK